MFVRRGRAPVRLGAGLLLATACAAVPALALAVPASGEVNPLAGAECDSEAKPNASAADVALGTEVLVTGTCFEPYARATISIFVEGSGGSQNPKKLPVGADGSVSATFNPTEAGRYSIVINVEQQQATGSFEVIDESADPEEPTDPPPEEPAEPTEEPTEEPAEPTEEPTEEPTDPPKTEEPTDEPSDEPTTPAPTDDPSEPAPSDPAPSDEPSTPAPTRDPNTSAPAPGDQDDGGPQGTPSSPAKPSPSPEEDEEDPAAPSAADRPGASAQEPDSPAPTDPGSATDDVPAATPEYSADQKQAAALAVLMTSLFAHGVSEGDVGISPADAAAAGGGDASDEGGTSDGDASDSGDASDGTNDELAETGTNASTPAALAGLALFSGAGLLWHQRRRD